MTDDWNELADILEPCDDAPAPATDPVADVTDAAAAVFDDAAAVVEVAACPMASIAEAVAVFIPRLAMLAFACDIPA